MRGEVRSREEERGKQAQLMVGCVYGRGEEGCKVRYRSGADLVGNVLICRNQSLLRERDDSLTPWIRCFPRPQLV